MLPSYFIRILSLTLSLLLSAGCTPHHSRFDGDYDRYEDLHSQANADELLGFGARMSRMSASSRAKECRSLLKRQNKNPGTDTQLRLMVGRLHSDSCGDISKILRGVGSIPKGQLNQSTQNLIAIHTVALKHLNALSKKFGLLGSNQYKEASDSEVIDVKGSNKNETRLLREKLDAIRAMEKHLDDSDQVK
jgi:hypothetical protein